MSAFIPQYAKSTNTEVLAVIEHNTNGFLTWKNEACAFASRFGAKDGSFVPSVMFGSYSIRAINTPVRPTDGQWSFGYQKRGYRPRSGTPLAKEMDVIRWQREPYPGLPTSVEGPYNRDGSQTIMHPHPFVVDGVAWVGLSSLPVGDQSGIFNDAHDPAEYGPQWVEVRGSEYLTAREVYEDATKSVSA